MKTITAPESTITPHLHQQMAEIIAHRGASRECLENTIAAFDRALEQRADGIELDVHATSDGVVMVHHDPFVRADRAGRPDDRIVIADVSYDELSAIRLLNFEPMPRLDAVLERVGAKAVVYVEVKGVGIEQQVLECLARHPGTRTAVHAFDHRISVWFRQHNTRIRTGILSASYVMDFAGLIQSASANDLWQHAAMIDGELVHTAHSANARVVAWTENNAKSAQALLAMGVDAICTDTPGIMKQALATLP